VTDTNIRAARQADVKRLAELARKTFADAFGHSFAASDLAAHLASELSDACFERYLDDDTILVAEQGDRLIGFIQFGRAKAGMHESASPDDFVLRRVYVLDAFQGQGIGSRLIDLARSEPEMSGAPGIFLDVWEENVAAQSLYRRYGFETVGRRAFKVASGTTTGSDLIMVRRAR
jgi:ribosomal protein S18 acetylase RimI-like enzyme